MRPPLKGSVLFAPLPHPPALENPLAPRSVHARPGRLQARGYRGDSTYVASAKRFTPSMVRSALRAIRCRSIRTFKTRIFQPMGS